MRRNFIIAAVLVVLCLLVVPVSADWLTDWQYRKSHTINNTGSELTNYQMMFTVNRSSGTDTGCTVYVGTKCESDYDDIRFTTADGTTLLPYWIEDSDSNEADIWVNVSTITGSGDTTIYMYYGNSGASAVSNGTATFVGYDDFTTYSDGSNLFGQGGWTANPQNTGSFTENSDTGKMTTGGSARGYASWTPTGESESTVVVHFRVKPNSDSTDLYCFLRDSGGVTVAGAYFLNGNLLRLGNVIIKTGLSSSVYHDLDIKRVSSTKYQVVCDGEYIGEYDTTNENDILNVHYGHFDAGSTTNIDLIYQRKYAATEPTCSAWGSEETPYEITADFSGAPTSGYVPLTVYFTDSSASTGNETVIIDEWEWDFGDESAGSSDQNPAHQYTTSGTYTVALTASNATRGTTDTETKTDYITVSIDPSAPTADFVATPLCEDIGENIYFIDFSTGGGLYAWNWSFGDGNYSELRNPTHSYSANGTYDVGLTVWGATGTDTKTKTGYITIPCGAATPTPTPTPTTVTPTPTTSVTQGVLTEENITYIYSDEDQYVPLPLWLSVIGVMIAFFGHSIIFRRNTDLTATIACVLAFVAAGISNMIGYIDINVADINTTDVVVTTTIKAVHPPWLVWVMVMFAFVSIINVIYQAWKLYLKPKNWNEIYAKKYERY